MGVVPGENIVPESIHYFHQKVTLNNFYFLSDENILNLNQETEGVFFEVQLSGKTAKIIFIRYPRPQDSQAAFEKFRSVHFQEKTPKTFESTGKNEMVKRMPNGEFHGTKWTRNHLIIILGTSDEQSCQDLLGNMAKRLDPISE